MVIKKPLHAPDFPRGAGGCQEVMPPHRPARPLRPGELTCPSAHPATAGEN